MKEFLATIIVVYIAEVILYLFMSRRDIGAIKDDGFNNTYKVTYFMLFLEALIFPLVVNIVIIFFPFIPIAKKIKKMF